MQPMFFLVVQDLFLIGINLVLILQGSDSTYSLVKKVLFLLKSNCNSGVPQKCFLLFDFFF